MRDDKRHGNLRRGAYFLLKHEAADLGMMTCLETMHDIRKPADTDARTVRGTVRHVDSFADMKAEEYRYWQSRPVHERLAAVSALLIEGYRLKGTLLSETGLR